MLWLCRQKCMLLVVLPGGVRAGVRGVFGAVWRGRAVAPRLVLEGRVCRRKPRKVSFRTTEGTKRRDRRDRRDRPSMSEGTDMPESSPETAKAAQQHVGAGVAVRAAHHERKRAELVALQAGVEQPTTPAA